MVFVNYTYDMVINTQLHKFYGKSFAPVLYFILDAATQFCEKRYTVYSTTWYCLTRRSRAAGTIHLHNSDAWKNVLRVRTGCACFFVYFVAYNLLLQTQSAVSSTNGMVDTQLCKLCHNTYEGSLVSSRISSYSSSSTSISSNVAYRAILLHP